MTKRQSRESRPRRTAREWSALLERWRQSGQEIGVFCKKEDIVVRTFKWWLWRLGAESTAGAKLTKGGKGTARPKSGVSLVRVEVDRTGREARSDADGTGGWTLTTSKGHVLEVRGPVEDSGLRLVLDALSQKGGLR